MQTTMYAVESGACNACGSSSIKTLVDFSDIPVYTNVPQQSREAALNVARGRISLGYCDACGHLSNQAFDASLLDYAPGYEAALDFSPRFRRYADELARMLIARYGLTNKRIIEVACGQGAFLSRICELGDNSGVGFDPSYAGGESGEGDKIRFIRDYYGERYHHYEADFLCCRHALEHIPDPGDFIRNLRNALRHSGEPLVFFEVPNSLYTMRDLGIWDLIYEHCSYFSGRSLVSLFADNGFEIIDVGEQFEGQFLTIVARPTEANTTSTESQGGCIHDYVDAFGSNFLTKVSEWSARVEQFETQGKRVVIWGGGSKAITFLNVVGAGDAIEYVVDINPRKTGLYVPGTGQQIIQPSALEQYRPDTVIIMNPIYRQEIQQTLAQMDLVPEIILA